VISPPVKARYVRFNPVHWNARGGLPKHDICMRVGVFTCTGEKLLKELKLVSPIFLFTFLDLSLIFCIHCEQFYMSCDMKEN
jgi:hypothetical protein